MKSLSAVRRIIFSGMFIVLLWPVINLSAANIDNPGEDSSFPELDAFQKNPTCSNQLRLGNAMCLLKSKVMNSLYKTNPDYRKLADEYGRLKNAANERKKILITNSQHLRKLMAQRQKAQAAYESLTSYDSRRAEVSARRNEMEDLKNSIHSILLSDPGFEKILAQIEVIEPKFESMSDELIKKSNLAEAKKVKAAMQALDPESNPATKDFFPYSRIRKDVFDGLFKDIRNKHWGNDYRTLFRQFVRENLKKENPNASEEAITQMTSLISDNTSTADPNAINTFKPSTPLGEVYLTFLKYRKDKDLKEYNKSLRRIIFKFPVASASRLMMFYLLRVSTGERRFKNRIVLEIMKMLEKDTFKGKYAEIAYWNLVNYMPGKDWPDMERKILKLDMDPWLKNLLCGRSALRQAWKSRGGGYSDTVTRESWTGFGEHSKRAETYLQAAFKLHPDRAEPAVVMIETARGITSTANCIEWFKKAVTIQPDFRNAYSHITWAMLPRWGGSHEMMAALADACLDSEHYNTIIPAFGLDILNRVAADGNSYYWQEVYSNPERQNKILKLFANRIANSKGFILREMQAVKIMFLMACLRYADALHVLKTELGSYEEFSKVYDNYYWNLYAVTLWNPRMPVWEDYPSKLKLFTGKYGTELQKIEKEFIEGHGVAARIKLREIIKKGNFTGDDKDFLIDLYARFSMNLRPINYSKAYKTKKPRNAFITAAKEDFYKLMIEMLEMGYQYGKYESYPGETAVIAARYASDPEIFTVLKEQGDPLSRPDKKYKRQPLTIAAQRFNSPAVSQLVKLGVPLEAKSPEGHTALHLAASRKAVDVTLILLNAGAKPEAQDKDGDTPLMFAMQVNAPMQLWLPLIKKSENLNVVNGRGWSALHYAANYFKNSSVVPFMAKKGATVDLADRGGFTPLMIAVEQKKPDFINALVKAGADPNKKDRGGKSALMRAKNNEALIQALKGN